MNFDHPHRSLATALGAVAVLAAGLSLTACQQGTTEADEVTAEVTTAEAALPPEPSTTPPPTTVAVNPAAEAFVAECASHVAFKVQTADAAYTTGWGQLDPAGIDAECRRIATTDSAMVAAMQAEIVQLREFLEAAEANATTTTTRSPPPPPPAPTPSGPPPTIRINCGPPVTGTWDWYRIDYGYAVNSAEPLIELGMDYGDGDSYVVHDQVSAQQDLYWHEYHSPGSYNVRAWVVDSFGRRDDTACTFTWYDGGSNRAASSGYDTGDLDCEDIGEEVYIDGDDPDNLDADGDGVGCEGW